MKQHERQKAKKVIFSKQVKANEWHNGMQRVILLPCSGSSAAVHKVGKTALTGEE